MSQLQSCEVISMIYLLSAAAGACLTELGNMSQNHEVRSFSGHDLL